MIIKECKDELGNNMTISHKNFEDLNQLLINLSPGYQKHFNEKLFEQLN